MCHVLTVGQWSYEAAQVFLAQMRAELKNTKIHAYLDVSVVYGRKPGGKPRSIGGTSKLSGESGHTITPMPSNSTPQHYHGMS